MKKIINIFIPYKKYLEMENFMNLDEEIIIIVKEEVNKLFKQVKLQ